MDKTPYTSLDKAHFVVGILPAVIRVSQETGLSSDLILAQAIQETGWGRSMHHGQAAGTFNLFGVKADKNWDGQTKDIVTHEYINGEKITVTDKFRVYSSYDESLLDRAKFLQENPRYNKLLETGTKGDFLKESTEIQKAGWATDPEYAQNLAAVFQGKTIREALKIITERNFTAGFGDFTNPNSPYKSIADTNENLIPDILESKKPSQDKMHSSQNHMEPAKLTQDQIVANLILQNIRNSLGRDDPIPLIHISALQSELN